MVAFVASTVLTAANLNSAFNQKTINTQTGTTYTLVLTDQGGVITTSNASAVTVTIPPFASVAFATGTIIDFVNLDAGTLTIAAGAGVTISGTITALATNGSASIMKTATNTWSYIASGGGKVLQIVNAQASAPVSNSTSTPVDTGLTATITPSSASNKILVTVAQSGLGKTTNNTSVGVKLLRGATSILNPFELAATTASGTTVTTGAGCATFLDSPSTTSATTYKTQCWSSQNNAVVNVQSNGSYSTITLMEISA